MSQGVETGAVEAPVDAVLHERTERAEPKRDGERRRRRGPGGPAAERDAERERDTDVGARQQEGEERVDERAVDQALDRVQAVAGNGDPNGRRHRRLHHQEEREYRVANKAAEYQPRRRAEEQPERNQRSRPGEPQRLQPLDSDRSPEAEADRDRPGEEACQDAEPERNPDSRPHERLADGVVGQGVDHRGVVLEWRWGEHRKRHEADEADDGGAGRPAPAA